MKKFVRVRLLLTHNSHVGKNYVATFFAQKNICTNFEQSKKKRLAGYFYIREFTGSGNEAFEEIVYQVKVS